MLKNRCFFFIEATQFKLQRSNGCCVISIDPVMTQFKYGRPKMTKTETDFFCVYRTYIPNQQTRKEDLKLFCIGSDKNANGCFLAPLSGGGIWHIVFLNAGQVRMD